MGKNLDELFEHYKGKMPPYDEYSEAYEADVDEFRQQEDAKMMAEYNRAWKEASWWGRIKLALGI